MADPESSKVQSAPPTGKAWKTLTAEGLGAFLMDAPLYEEHTAEKGVVTVLYGWSPAYEVARTLPPTRFDGYCPSCKRDTTYTLKTFLAFSEVERAKAAPQVVHRLGLICARDTNHDVQLFVRQEKDELQKVGQFPSLADIANSETHAKYRSVLKGENRSELYKAIGLAAHGEGIGSFVYLRRVLERLVKSRFDEHRSAEQWDETHFRGLRMEDKIKFLEKYLPAFLVTNRKLYGIFSQGIHELSNEECRRFFDVGTGAIFMILQDDLRRREEAAARKDLESAISGFTSDSSE